MCDMLEEAFATLTSPRCNIFRNRFDVAGTVNNPPRISQSGVTTTSVRNSNNSLIPISPSVACQVFTMSKYLCCATSALAPSRY